MDDSNGTPRVGIVEDPRFGDHVEPAGHPERAERLTAVTDAIDLHRNRLKVVPARPAESAEILAIHDDAHLSTVEEAARAGAGRLDQDTYVSADSFDVAQLAAGGSVELVHRILAGELDTGFAAVRPPGHHAEADQAMGFCLFNNVAVAARSAQQAGAERIAIFDWDVHHGNGTQHSFETDPNVFYISSHQFPYYPGSGDFGEAGIGRGEGATLNLPLPAGCGDAEYLGIVQRVVAPALEAFRPELILVSAGFDAHRDDPLASMNVSGAGYGAMTRVMRELAAELCGGRLAFILEGGYALSGLREGVDALLSALCDGEPASVPKVQLPPETVLAQVLDRVEAAHQGWAPDRSVA